MLACTGLQAAAKHMQQAHICRTYMVVHVQHTMHIARMSMSEANEGSKYQWRLTVERFHKSALLQGLQERQAQGRSAAH